MEPKGSFMYRKDKNILHSLLGPVLCVSHLSGLRITHQIRQRGIEKGINLLFSVYLNSRFFSKLFCRTILTVLHDSVFVVVFSFVCLMADS